MGAGAAKSLRLCRQCCLHARLIGEEIITKLHHQPDTHTINIKGKLEDSDFRELLENALAIKASISRRKALLRNVGQFVPETRVIIQAEI